MPVQVCMWEWVCVIACVPVYKKKEQLLWRWLPGELKLMSIIRSKQRARHGQLIQARRAEPPVRSARLELERWRIKMRPQTNSTQLSCIQQMSTEGRRCMGAWHGHASTRQLATRPARPNTSWQPPGSILITPSSLFSWSARGEGLTGAPMQHSKWTPSFTVVPLCVRAGGTQRRINEIIREKGEEGALRAS